MEVIVILLIGIIAVTFVIIAKLNNRDQSSAQNTDETLKQYIDKEENEFQNRQKLKTEMIENTNKVFNDIGWTEWDMSIHCAEGQFDRMLRSSEKDAYRLVCLNPRTSNAKILSKSGKYYLTSGHRCSCPDFRERGLPCKHMYFLSYVIPDYKELFPNLKKGNSLKGLNFCICGRGQADVKEYIVAHGGTLGNLFISETSAVILASEIESSVVTTAREHNMEILTFEQLKTLFSDN